MTHNSDLRILIIDDNKAIHQDFIKILTADHAETTIDDLDRLLYGEEKYEGNVKYLPKFQIDTALQGQEGVQFIKKALNEKRPYALAFVDIRMPPGWDGVETIKHIWSISPDTQVVICTAYSDYSWKETVNELGITDKLLVLKKPFDNQVVRQISCALTKKWRLEQVTKEHTKALDKIIRERTNYLKKCYSLVRVTLKSSLDGIIIVDNENKIIDLNDKFSHMWSIPHATNDYKTIKKHILAQLKNPNKFLIETQKNASYPEKTWMETIELIKNKVYEVYSQPYKLDNKIVGRAWIFRDITERTSFEKQLEYQVTHDLLTGLPNRFFLMDHIHQEMLRADREKKNFAVLFFDIDGFKVINDTLGHLGGDRLLKAVAQRLKKSVRAMDRIARFGGDEFVMIVSELARLDSVLPLVNELFRVMREPFKIGSDDVAVKFSMGISFYPKNSNNVDDLINYADLAMYEAKAMGGNQFQFYTQKLQKLQRD